MNKLKLKQNGIKSTTKWKQLKSSTNTNKGILMGSRL